MKRLVSFLFLGCLAAWLPLAHAELVLIANPHSGVERLSQDDVINIYLGRYRRLASGIAAEPLDQPVDSEPRGQFYRRLVNKSLAEINAYWARLVFSGKTRPPLVAEGHDEILRLVSAHPGALAYVDRTWVDSRVRIVFAFEE